MRKVLVTGGAGYIGSHTCKALAAAGYTPVAYDNLVSGHRRAVQWGPFEHGDVLDQARLDEVIAAHKPDAVLHFSAFAYVGESVVNPGKYYRNNVAGSLALLQAMQRRGIDRMVFSSSCAVYGVPDQLPITEQTPRKPINPYGMSKFMVEQMLADFQVAYGLQWVALRYFNAAGADPDGEIGEDHDPETHVIPLILETVAGLRKSVTIMGTDYDTPDGTCVRDYVHVSDLADAHVQALAALENGFRPGALNLGVGKGHSVREVIGAVERVAGCKVPVVTGPRREGDPAILVSDARRARDVLGWKPRFPRLDDIVRSAWNWQQKKLRASSAWTRGPG